MNKATNQFMPRARKDGLVVRELSGELLVYDRDRNKAHCLNETAALIWQNCDGQTTIAELRARLEDRMANPVDEQIVWYALNKFSKSLLLEEPLKASAGARGLSRRELIQTIGLGASIPLIISVVAPSVFAAASCTQPCTIPPNCTVPGCLNCPVPGTCQP